MEAILNDMQATLQDLDTLQEVMQGERKRTGKDAHHVVLDLLDHDPELTVTSHNVTYSEGSTYEHWSLSEESTQLEHPENARQILQDLSSPYCKRCTALLQPFLRIIAVLRVGHWPLKIVYLLFKPNEQYEKRDKGNEHDWCHSKLQICFNAFDLPFSMFGGAEVTLLNIIEEYQDVCKVALTYNWVKIQTVPKH